MNVVTKWLKQSMSDRQVVLLVSFLLGAFLILYFFGNMIAPVLAAIVFAFLLDGPAERLRKKGVPHLLAVVIVFLAFLLLSFVAFFTILPPITQQVGQFIGSLPGMLNTIKESAGALLARYPELVDPSQVDALVASIQRGLLELGQQFLTVSVGNIVGLITVVVYAILVPVMVFFFLKDKAAILKWFSSFLPADRQLADQVWEEVLSKTGKYARGKVFEIFIVGFTAWAVFWLVGLPYAAFLAFLTGISVIVPYIGATLVTIPVVVVAYAHWGFQSDFFVAVGLYIVLQILDGNVLVPLLFSEMVRLHPNAIILAILVFGGLWGFWGVFFAIPLATLAHAVIRAWPRQREAVKSKKA